MSTLKRIFSKFLKYWLSPEAYAKRIGVTIGESCKISTKFWGSEPFLINIGNHVHITTDVRFINHDGGVWVFRNEIPDFDVFGKITIDDNTYIGNNSVIMPGVSIGKNCVIGANSVVTKSVPSNCVVAGVPAKYIMSTESYRKKLLEKNVKIKLLRTPENEKEIFAKIPASKFLVKELIITGNK